MLFDMLLKTATLIQATHYEMWIGIPVNLEGVLQYHIATVASVGQSGGWTQLPQRKEQEGYVGAAEGQAL